MVTTFTPTSNPMVITAAASVVLSRPILARRIEWVGAATVGNFCQITDVPGGTFTATHIIAEGYCGAVDQAVTLWAGPAKLTLPGKQAAQTYSNATQASYWQVSTIQSGTLLIWY